MISLLMKRRARRTLRQRLKVMWRKLRRSRVRWVNWRNSSSMVPDLKLPFLTSSTLVIIVIIVILLLLYVAIIFVFVIIIILTLRVHFARIRNRDHSSHTFVCSWWQNRRKYFKSYCMQITWMTVLRYVGYDDLTVEIASHLTQYVIRWCICCGDCWWKVQNPTCSCEKAVFDIFQRTL